MALCRDNKCQFHSTKSTALSQQENNKLVLTIRESLYSTISTIFPVF